MIAPLSFADPQRERETYVAAFVATLNDKSDGNPSLEKSIRVLLAYGYDRQDIDKYVEDAHQKQFDMTRKGA